MTDEKIYRASIHFYSNSTDDMVTVMTDFSDGLAEGADIPAAYSQAQFVAMALRTRAVTVELDEDATAILEDETLSNEERAAAMLAQVSPADAVAAEITK